MPYGNMKLCVYYAHLVFSLLMFCMCMDRSSLASVWVCVCVCVCHCVRSEMEVPCSFCVLTLCWIFLLLGHKRSSAVATCVHVLASTFLHSVSKVGSSVFKSAFNWAGVCQDGWHCTRMLKFQPNTKVHKKQGWGDRRPPIYGWIYIYGIFSFVGRPGPCSWKIICWNYGGTAL